MHVAEHRHQREGHAVADAHHPPQAGPAGLGDEGLHVDPF